jgi:hypothetical protein
MEGTISLVIRCCKIQVIIQTNFFILMSYGVKASLDNIPQSSILIDTVKEVKSV